MTDNNAPRPPGPWDPKPGTSAPTTEPAVADRGQPRTAEPPLVDNHARRFLPALGLLGAASLR